MTRPAPVTGIQTLLAPLTRRELDVVHLIAAGRTNSEIADSLAVAQATMKTHVNRMFTKLGIESRAHLIVLAYECRYVVPGALAPPGP